MTRGLRKTTFREIRQSLGRFFAIAAIIALGVGFFAGLKITTEDMIEETDGYLKALDFHDFRFISTLGFTDNELMMLQSTDGVKAAYGEYRADAVTEPLSGSGIPVVTAFHSISQEVNKPDLISGRMPQNASEVLLEARSFSEDMIGKKIVLSDINTEETFSQFREREFTIVGLAHSPLYLNYERGTTPLLSGSVGYYAMLLPEAYNMPAYTSLYCTTESGGRIYSDAYKKRIERETPKMEQCLQAMAEARKEGLRPAVMEAFRKAVAEEYASHGMQVPADFDYEANLPEMECTTYLLDRTSNVGYVCFENDANIVKGIARVFPVFFILVAVLVVMTTMSRMVEEQRTQMGVLKALGYSASQIAMKYVIYSGTAAVAGCLIGFFSGCYIFPTVIWKVYAIMYGFTDDLVYVFDPTLFAITLTVSILCSVGVTLWGIARELRAVPAELIRPRAPKNGKRIFFERITFLWKRLPFLHKVSLRNVVRYRRRFLMMVIGIAGCTALLITGHGIRDSIVTVPKAQYEEIEHYDYLVRLAPGKSRVGFEQETDGRILSEMTFVCYNTITLQSGSKTKTANLVVPMNEQECARFVTLATESGKNIAFPGDGECVLSGKMAGQLGVGKGDTLRCRKDDGKEFTVRVSGVFRNYVGDLIYMNAETYTEGTGTKPVFDCCFARAKEGTDVYETGGKLLAADSVMTVNVNREFRDRIEKMLSSLDYIVILVIVCAAALAFIVLYNLTNINITERLREIATIKVLGFYGTETAMYVFRENMLLTAAGAIAGIPLGILLHKFVMSQIQVDMVAFNNHVGTGSFVVSMIYTFVFAVLVDLVMIRRLEKINMAESMKSIE
ncbi:MAG: ABC transporter permease [Lachnospiraceae bacterium]|nr:ABC transporter permease [Lachnospiraceae bacterium]